MARKTKQENPIDKLDELMKLLASDVNYNEWLNVRDILEGELENVTA